MSYTMLELWNRVRDRFRRDQLAADLDDELRFHQTMLERDRVSAGATPADARRASRMRLGNPTYVREATRAAWTLGWVDDVLHDLRFAARVLRRNVTFTTAVVLTLALGIGANTAIFSVVNAVILRPLPFADPDRLYSLWTVPAAAPADRNPTTYPDLHDWRAQSTAFADIGGYAFNRFEIPGGDVARGIMATPSVYPIIGAQALIGRLPAAAEEHLPVVTISYRLWQRRFGGDRNVVGTSVRLGEQAYTIVGVMPPGFHFPTPDIDLWLSIYPIADAPGHPAINNWIVSRSLHGYRAVGRLRPGVTQAAAESEMNAIAQRLAIAYPETNVGTSIKLQSVRAEMVGNVQRILWLILGAAGLVLLLACANVAHLMLARMSSRSREIAVRRALGAHRGRVVRQLLTESVLLGAIGGAVGVSFAIVGIRLLVRLSPGDIPRLETVSLDPATLLFAAAASLLTGILFGVAPTAVAWTSGTNGMLREQIRGGVGGSGARARSALMTAEVAFALILLMGAGLMLRSFASLLLRDPGFRADHVVAFQLGISSTRYPAPANRGAIVDRVLTRLSAIPGVTGTGASTSMPPSRMQQSTGYTVVGTPALKAGEEPSALYIPASPGFLSALGIAVLRGRDFTAGDGASAARVTIINGELARRDFHDRNPLGHQISAEGETWTIVGVARDVPYQGLASPIEPGMYVPWVQDPGLGAWVVVKATLPAAAVLEPIRAALHEVDPMMSPLDARAMEDVVGATMVRPRFQTWLLGSFGVVALLLAGIGIYGVISYGVAQRTSEIGLRLALGAPRGTVVGLILRRGLMPVVTGLVVGVAGAFALTRLMASLLYDVSATDTATFVATTLLLAIVAVVAAYVPAARAARLDPLSALRQG